MKEPLKNVLMKRRGIDVFQKAVFPEVLISLYDSHRKLPGTEQRVALTSV